MCVCVFFSCAFVACRQDSTAQEAAALFSTLRSDFESLVVEERQRLSADHSALESLTSALREERQAGMAEIEAERSRLQSTREAEERERERERLEGAEERKKVTNFLPSECRERERCADTCHTIPC